MRAITLLEIMIAMSIFGLMLLAIATLYITGYRSYSQGTQSSRDFREASIGLETMLQDLRQCEKIYALDPGGPTPITLAAGYAPVLGKNSPFCFVKQNFVTRSPEVVAFVLDSSSQLITRFLYSPSFDPSNSTTWEIQSAKPVIQRVDAFSLKLTGPGSGNLIRSQFLEVRVVLIGKHGEVPLESSARIQGGF